MTPHDEENQAKVPAAYVAATSGAFGAQRREPFVPRPDNITEYNMLAINSARRRLKFNRADIVRGPQTVLSSPRALTMRDHKSAAVSEITRRYHLGAISAHDASSAKLSEPPGRLWTMKPLLPVSSPVLQDSSTSSSDST